MKDAHRAFVEKCRKNGRRNGQTIQWLRALSKWAEAKHNARFVRPNSRRWKKWNSAMQRWHRRAETLNPWT